MQLFFFFFNSPPLLPTPPRSPPPNPLPTHLAVSLPLQTISTYKCRFLFPGSEPKALSACNPNMF